MVDLRDAAAYAYALPEELIAKAPVTPADASRLLVVHDGERANEDRTFADFPQLLRAGDVLAINETSVVRARLRGTRANGGGAIELVLLRPEAGGAFDFRERRWSVLARPGRRLTPGTRVRFDDRAACTVIAAHADGTRTVEFDANVDLQELTAAHGELPLPPYVGPGDDARAERYQTMFARVPGSIAAPTASLHFTPRVVDAIRARGVIVAALVLDVGLGTFKPMAAGPIDAHVMHAERFTIPDATASAIASAKRDGRRVVCAGTTTLRALEASAALHGRVVAETAETSLFITPGFRFRVADALLTNFHLPSSTLLVLVSAFAGYDTVRRAYADAMTRGYRFFSFGDAMFVTVRDPHWPPAVRPECAPSSAR